MNNMTGSGGSGGGSSGGSSSSFIGKRRRRRHISKLEVDYYYPHGSEEMVQLIIQRLSSALLQFSGLDSA